jgi:hypothetical protein
MPYGFTRGKDLGADTAHHMVGTAAAAHDARASAPVSSARSGAATASTIAFSGVVGLVLLSPFEMTEPLLRLPGQSISSVETVLLAMLGAWAASMAVARTLPATDTPLTRPWLALLAAMAMAAVLAPAHRANALHMVGRLTLAFGIYLAVVNGVVTRGRARALLLAVSIAGATAAALVIMDFFDVAPAVAFLGLFRAQAATIGAQVRASGPFQYPTIASMFLEVAFACAVGVLLLAIDGRRYRSAVIAFGALVLIAEGVTLTYTRSGLVTIVLTLVIAAGGRGRPVGDDPALPALALLGVVVGTLFLASRSSEGLRLRLTTEGQDEWFRAEIAAPDHLNLSTGGRVAVDVTVTNTGQLTWDSQAAQPFGFSYHWLLADSDHIVSWEGIRALFPSPVKPGQTVTVRALVEAPRQPGEFRIVWDLYQEGLLWFSTEPGARLFVSRATVSGAPSGQPVAARDLGLMPGPAERPGRRVLWAAALRMIRAHPWLGVGPDNFRLLYGDYSQLVRADPRVHSNNMYLEVVSGGGVVAGLCLAWLLWRAGRVALSTLWQSSETAVVGNAAGAVCAAIAVHGLADSFVSFTATYTLIAVALGLLVSNHTLHHAHAHRF